jgi:hypothetical protein
MYNPSTTRYTGSAYHLQNNGDIEDEETDILKRTLVGTGSFVTRIELNNLDLGGIEVDSSPDSVGQISVLYRLHEDPSAGRNTIAISLNE